MLLKKISNFSKIIYIIIFCLTTISYGVLEINQVCGLYNAIAPVFKHLSPFHGFIFFERNITRNYYEYAPQDDAIAILVRDLFKLDGDTFKATARRDHIGMYLDSGTIGKLLFQIEISHDKKELYENLKKVIENRIKEAVGTKREDIKRAFSTPKRMNETINAFTGKLINALEASGHFSKDNQVYPKNTAHFILLSFLYTIIEQRADLQKYFEPFLGAGILAEDISCIYNPDAQRIILREFETNTMGQKEDEIWNYAIENYEPMGFAIIAAEKYGGLYPSYIGYAKALPDWFKKFPSPENYAYTDCMETASRNLFNFVFYDNNSREFILPDLIDKASIGAQFYSEFAPSAILSRAAHDKWSSIVSDIPEVLYKRRAKIENEQVITEVFDDGIVRPSEPNGWFYYELKANLNNLWKVVGHIFNLKLKNLGDFIEIFQLTCVEEKTAEEAICKITDKNKRECTLNIMPKHAEIRGFKSTQLSFEKLHKIIFNKLMKKEYTNMDLALNLYGLDTESYPMIYSADRLRYSGYLRSIIMTQQLENNNKKIQIIQFLLHGIRNLEFADWTWYTLLIKNLTNSLIKLNDAHVMWKLFFVLLTGRSDNLITWITELIEEQFNVGDESIKKTIKELIQSQFPPENWPLIDQRLVNMAKRIMES